MLLTLYLRSIELATDTVTVHDEAKSSFPYKFYRPYPRQNRPGYNL